MRDCVSDKHLERLKVRVTNYQIGGISPPNLDKGRKRKCAWNLGVGEKLTEHKSDLPLIPI